VGVLGVGGEAEEGYKEAYVVGGETTAGRTMPRRGVIVWFFFFSLVFAVFGGERASAHAHTTSRVYYATRLAGDQLQSIQLIRDANASI